MRNLSSMSTAPWEEWRQVLSPRSTLSPRYACCLRDADWDQVHASVPSEERAPLLRID